MPTTSRPTRQSTSIPNLILMSSTPVSSPTLSDTTSVNKPSPQSQLESRAESLSRLVARDVFGIPMLYPPHVVVLKRLAMMKFRDSPLKPSSLIFVHPTGGGKSLVRDVHSVLFRGVSLTIVPVLSLGADLSIKV